MTIRKAPMSNWRAQSLDRFNRTSPNLRLIDACLKVYFGFFFNGGFVRRPVRGNKNVPSIHSWGAAVDSSYRNSTRAKALQAIDWLIANSEELQIESIHDYMGSRIWHADRSTPQDSSAGGGGWKAFTGEGTPNGDWLHIETTLAGWGDETPIGLRPGLRLPGATDAAPLGECKCDEVAAAATPEWPAFNPAQGLWGLWPVAAKPALRVGLPRTPEVNDATLYLQGVLKAKAGQTVTVDGDFGAQTKKAVENAQKFFKLTVDGAVGNQTWALIDKLATQ